MTVIQTLIEKALKYRADHGVLPGPEDLGLKPTSGDYQTLVHKELAQPSGPWGALGPGPHPTGPKGP
jgi:hypothetical protein